MVFIINIEQAKNMTLQSLKLITFDVTNTLLKFSMPPWQYYALVAKNYGFIGTEDDVKAKLNVTIKDMWSKYPNYGKSSINWENWWSQVVKMTLRDYLPLTADLDGIACKLINEYKTSKCWSIADGGADLLDQIKQLKVVVGVISNFDPRLNELLKNLGLHNKFDFIITSYDVGFSKPDKQIFKSAIEISKVDIKPFEALHIGDDLEKDYIGARSAGWNAILVHPNMKTEATVSPHHVYNSLEDLCTAIKLKTLRL